MATSLEVLSFREKDVKKTVFHLNMQANASTTKNITQISSKMMPSVNSSQRDLNDYPKPKFNHD